MLQRLLVVLAVLRLVDSQNLFTIKRFKQPFQLPCNISGTPVPDGYRRENITWVYSAEGESTLNALTIGGRYSLAGNGALKVDSARATDTGTYACTYDKRQFKVTVVLQPILKPLPKSKNVVQGDQVVVKCVVSASDDKLRIAWSFKQSEDSADATLIGEWNADDPDAAGTTVKAAAGSTPTKEPVDDRQQGNSSRFTARMLIDSENNERILQLVAKDVQEADIAWYVCNSTNAYGVGSAQFLLRVKDKYAALWPFIGIVIEVVVLCAVIFIYERRHDKQQADDDNDDDKKPPNHTRSENQELRQRKN